MSTLIVLHSRTFLFFSSDPNPLLLSDNFKQTVNQSHTLTLYLANLSQYLFRSVQFSCSVVSDSSLPHESQHARPPCPSPNPGVHSDSRPSSQWCQPAILILCCPLLLLPPIPPSIKVFSKESTLPMRWPKYWVSALASFLPKKSQGWSPSEWAGWISLQSKGLSRVFSNTTVQKHQFFSPQLSSQSNSHIHTWPLEKP